MKLPFAKYVMRLHPRKCVGVVASALLAGAAIGWAMSTVSTTRAAAVEDLSAFEMRRNVTPTLRHDELKHRLVGSYVVGGTDTDGKPYGGTGIVDVARRQRSDRG